jgi:hypothetical protein
LPITFIADRYDLSRFVTIERGRPYLFIARFKKVIRSPPIPAFRGINLKHLTFVLCVGFDLLFQGMAMYQIWLKLLPGFTWSSWPSWPSFLLGLVESFAYVWYAALVFGPLYNFFVPRLAQRSRLGRYKRSRYASNKMRHCTINILSCPDCAQHGIAQCSIHGGVNERPLGDTGKGQDCGAESQQSEIPQP